MVSAKRVAIVHDWLDTWRGGENVLAAIVGLYPDADLFALVDFLPDNLRSRLGGKRATTSFLQRMPGARRWFRNFLPLFPRAIESLDLSGYDLVMSSSHAVAKGVRTSRAQLHVCYCHTPMRYAWDLREQYLRGSDMESGMRGAVVRRILDRLRDWDRAASVRVDHFVANSAFIRARIKRCYDRDATVIYPPVDVDFFTPGDAISDLSARNHYLTASRWVPYKRIDLIVAAFAELPDSRLIVAGEGPEARRVRPAAGTNVEFVGDVPRERLRELMRGARAFLFAAEEDFGIVPVEAQACGTPVIAFGCGGALETVRGLDAGRPTGVFFPTQSVDAIVAAIGEFENRIDEIDGRDCRANATQFAPDRFRLELDAFVESAWARFRARRPQ